MPGCICGVSAGSCIVVQPATRSCNISSGKLEPGSATLHLVSESDLKHGSLAAASMGKNQRQQQCGHACMRDGAKLLNPPQEMTPQLLRIIYCDPLELGTLRPKLICVAMLCMMDVECQVRSLTI